jgi:4-diphosphocytidyl-2-C-methyl-D-erythritol kinase
MESKQQFEMLQESLLVRAPAKINLSLLVAGKRPDGYHELETIMAKINWYDEILIEPGLKPGIELVCTGPQWAPAGEENLVYKAAKLLLESRGLKSNLRITLTKNIPAGSGLGSGSSDAAATLMGINMFLKLGVDTEHLMQAAATLGSDVPFFLNGPLALCTGKGEKIKKLDNNFDFIAVLILPDVSVSTKEVYANYRHDQDLYKNLHKTIMKYIEKNRVDLAAKICANMLTESCFDIERELAELKGKIDSFGIKPVCLTGSGSAMFCITADEGKAQAYKAKITENIGCKSVIVMNNRW